MILNVKHLAALFFVFLTVTAARADDGQKPPLNVAPSVDLSRYVGKWYELAHMPFRFQRDCAGDTTATYALREDGKISVLNACRTVSGKINQAKGTARIADAKGPNTKLKVTFFWPFSGNYWIIDLDPDYKWAVVGEPKRRYLWVLSREPKMDEATFKGILDRARQQGYDLDSLIVTKHS